MKIASVAEIKSKLSEYIKESRKGAVVITRNGKPAAVLISVTSDDQLEQLILSQSPMLKSILDKSEKKASARKMKHKEFWEELSHSEKQ
jgi:prevent-host-death family protein